MIVKNKPFRCNICHRVMFKIGGIEYDHYKTKTDHMGRHVSYPNLGEYKWEKLVG